MRCLTLVNIGELDALLVVNPESVLEAVSSNISSLTVDSSSVSDKDIII